MGILKRARRLRGGMCHRFGAGAVSIGVLWVLSGVCFQAREVSLEYQVKAVYLFNFAKFIEWPAEAPPGPITICVASENPFGDVLEETLRGEMVNGRPLAIRATGLRARVLQHEIDHLDGVLFIDRVDPVTRDRIKRKIKKDGLREDASRHAFAL